MTAFFRIHWLPSDIDNTSIIAYFNKNARFLTTMEIKKEKSLIDPRIENRIVKLKVEYDVKYHQNVLCDLSRLK